VTAERFATVNGLEGAAALYNDSLIALDEINQGDPQAVDKALYTIANGAGKQRAGRTGKARPVERWRTFLVSTGEKTMETHLREAGIMLVGAVRAPRHAARLLLLRDASSWRIPRRCHSANRRQRRCSRSPHDRHDVSLPNVRARLRL
jgi:hypothetical protein